jgi:hypothetical protein
MRSVKLIGLSLIVVNLLYSVGNVNSGHPTSNPPREH